MFNSARCLTCFVPWLFLLFDYKRVRKSCVTNAQEGLYYFFLSGFPVSGFHSPCVGLTDNTLINVLLFERCCHFCLINLFILFFRFVYRTLKFGSISLFSFPLTKKTSEWSKKRKRESNTKLIIIPIEPTDTDDPTTDKLRNLLITQRGFN